MSVSTYLRSFAASVCVSLAVVALLNRAVNPYSVFHNEWVSVSAKPETFTHLRLVKAWEVKHLRPKSLILGSSRAETGLDPQHPGWAFRPVYNLGLSNASVFEVRRYFEHACAVGDVRQAVLLLDFTSFLSGRDVAPDYLDERLADVEKQPQAYSDIVASLFTWDAAVGSILTLLGREGDKVYDLDGSRNMASEDERVLSKGGAARSFIEYERRVVSTTTGAHKGFDPQSFEDFVAILRCARLNSVDLRLAIAPMHFRYLELLDRMDQWPMYLDWRRELLRVLYDEAGDRPIFPLLDFGGYNECTTEPVPPNGIGPFFYEASHFSKRLGLLVLDHVLSFESTPDSLLAGEFGVPISQSNIDEHLRGLGENRNDFRGQQQTELKRLHEVWDSMGRSGLHPVDVVY